MSVDLTKFVQSWALSWARARGGASDTAIDQDRTNALFAQYYDRYGVETIWSLGDVNITSHDSPEVAVYSLSYGPFPGDQSINFAHTYVATDSFQWNITESIAVGVSATVSAGVPGIFSADLGTTLDLSVSSTQGQTKDTSTSWDTSLNFALTAGESVTIEMVIVRTQASGTVPMTGTMTGNVAVGLGTQWQGHYFWFVPVTDLYAEANSPLGYITVVGDAIKAEIPVKFSGQAATQAYIRETRKTSDGQVKVINHPPVTRPTST